MIRTIIFDLGEVYIKGMMGVEHRLQDILKMPSDVIRSRLYGPEFILLMEGKLTENAFWQKVLERTRWSISVSALKKTIRKNFEEIAGTRKIIEKLKEKGFKLGLLSDHVREWISYCNKKFEYHALFHSAQYSFEVHLRKTDRKAFEMLLQKLQEKPEQCLFVDDSVSNIQVAQSVGINTILFRNSEQLKKALASFLIVVD